MSGPILGIDLGTTNSVCALFEDGNVRFIDNPLGDRITPSVVAMDPGTGTCIVGRTAKDMLATSPHIAVSAFKRSMGSEETFALGGQSLTPVDLSAYVLDALRSDAERALGREVNRCVVTVPAYFNEAQRFATKRAAEVAGFAVERVLNEPTAAAIAYGLHRQDVECTFLVFDLGGGTFDVCVMELFEGMLSVKSVAGESRLGGEDFTASLVELACARVGVDPARARAEDADAWALAFKRAEMLKRQLSRWPSAEITLPPVRNQLDVAAPVMIDAGEAEQAWKPLVERLLGPCRSALRGAAVTPGDLSEIILVGGATRMPCVRRFVADVFGCDPLAELDPDLVVARGAAIQAALCADDDAVSDMVVTDVASHSLGTDTAREVGPTIRGGYFSPIIHRNTVIPTSRTEYFFPMHDGQTEVVFGIYEGEARRVEGNTKIGELHVTGLPARRDDAQLACTFTYDLNGILEVEAKIVKTGKLVSKVFERDGKPLSDEELARARSRLRQIRADPAERPRYRDLVARANLLWKESDAAARARLGAAIDDFEAAVATRTPQLIEQAYKSLLAICESLDAGERW